MNYAQRRKNLKKLRTGGLDFIDNVLPAAMPLEHIDMIVKLQRQAREPHASPADIIIPQRTGEMLSAAEYKLGQRAPALSQHVIVEIDQFRQRLRTETKETVENWTDEDFLGFLNGVGYGVPKRGRKQLPMTLAQHYRTKRAEQARGAEYEAKMGLLRGDESPDQDTDQFERAVRSYDGIEAEDARRQVLF